MAQRNPIEDLVSMALAAGITPEQLSQAIQQVIQEQGQMPSSAMGPSAATGMPTGPGIDPASVGMPGMPAGGPGMDPGMINLGGPPRGIGGMPSPDMGRLPPMMAGGGTTRILNGPTTVSGNRAEIPLSRPAKVGAGSGAAIAEDDMLAALAEMPKNLRDTYVDCR